MSSRFRRLTDLYVNGKTVVLQDGTYLWVQALNSYQRDECVSDAQVARSRLVMALRQKGDERLKIEGKYFETGRDAMIEDLATHRSTAKMGKFVDDMRADPDWSERMDILMRTDEHDTAAPMTHEEIALLAEVNQAIMDELARREVEEKAYLTSSLSKLTDDEIIDEWTEDWLENRGGEIAQGEYKLTECWFATRWCSATRGEDDVLDHSSCDGHQQKVFENRQKVRDVPTALTTLIQDTLAELNVAGSDPKDSGSPESSSSSSPTPSEPEDSTPSTSTGTSSKHPGTSTTPSGTP